MNADRSIRCCTFARKASQPIRLRRFQSRIPCAFSGLAASIGCHNLEAPTLAAYLSKSSKKFWFLQIEINLRSRSLFDTPTFIHFYSCCPSRRRPKVRTLCNIHCHAIWFSQHCVVRSCGQRRRTCKRGPLNGVVWMSHHDPLDQWRHARGKSIVPECAPKCACRGDA